MKDQPRRQATTTSSFGVGRRESHDSSGFYSRFVAPEISADDQVTLTSIDRLGVTGDARSMTALPDNSVALVVTSPPYFAGKEYEEALGHGHIPASYLEYLEMLRDVFAECKRVLEPGGRIAVNVANLGRKPYRSLSADVTRILEEDLGLLLRGEIIWRKAEGASGSCAWGSFRSPANPVLRDTTERVIVASKGRFDRALTRPQREKLGLPHLSTIGTDEFLEATLDVWSIGPESARRVNHPAPFPVELPQRLIELYTYAGDLVLDPFLGSGSTMVAAARCGRRCAGYDTDPAYVEAALRRLAEERTWEPGDRRPARTVAAELLADAGFSKLSADRRLTPVGLTLDFVAEDAEGLEWYFDLSGAFTTVPSGLSRSDAAWRAVGRAHALVANDVRPYVLLSSDLPRPRSEPDRAIRSVGPGGIFDVIALLDPEGRDRLRRYAKGGAGRRAESGYWTAGELDALTQRPRSSG